MWNFGRNPIRSDSAAERIAFADILPRKDANAIGRSAAEKKPFESFPGVKQYQAARFRLSWYLDTCAEYVTPAGHVTRVDAGDWLGGRAMTSGR